MADGFISDELVPLAQKNFLQRKFYEALIPTVQFLAAAELEEYGRGNGGTVISTVPGRKTPVLDPVAPKTDPTSVPTQYEWFRTTVRQYTGTDDVPMNEAYGTIADLYLQKMSELGIQCGTSLNLMVRNSLYAAYMAGNAVAINSAAPGTSLQVTTGNGFRETVVNGDPVAISSTNKKAIVVGTVSANAIAWTPDDAGYPDGPGVLTLEAAITWAANARVVAVDRSVILRPNNASTIDALSTSDSAKLALFRRAAAQLANDGVMPMADGYYHVHCSPFVLQELGSDNEYQRLFQGRPEAYMPDGSIGTIGKLKFFENNQTPQPGNLNSPNPLSVPTRATQLSPHYFAELYNRTGVQIERSIVVGRDAVSQLYVPELAAFVSNAGVIGKQQAGFQMVGNQLQMVMGPGTGQVRVIIRPPIDKLGQVVTITWSATRGFPVRANLLSGQSNGRFKKAMIVETGHEPIG